MAATAQPNGDVPNFKIVGKLDSVPVLHDSVTYAQSIIESTELTAKLYSVALAIASRSYQVATPALTRAKPLLESADGLAVATFDRAEATFPYPFKTPTQDLVVVKQVKGVYDARVLPVLQHASPVIHDVYNKTYQINSAIGSRAVATIHTSQDLAHALLAQLRQLAGNGKDIPGHLIDGVSKTANDLKSIVFAKDASLNDKSHKLTAYVVDQAKPLIDEIYNYVNSAKNKAVAETNKVADQANGTLENATH